MKNPYFIFIFFLFMELGLNAQGNLQKGIVVYNQIFYIDTVHLMGNETESFLFFDLEKQKSVYAWHRKSKAKSKELVKAEDGSYFMRVKNNGSDPIGNIVFKDYKNNNIVERKSGQNVKIIADSFSLNWSISEETKTLKDMVLQKAECDFRGRHYIAWFNPKIPISDGPWKLRGLPGLIIEAYDEKKHIQFNFTSLTMPAEFTEKIEAPSDGTHDVYDCMKFTAAHYQRVKELTRAMTGKMEQSGVTIQGGIESRPNLLERCY
jgi:GLPGLI family protein